MKRLPFYLVSGVCIIVLAALLLPSPIRHHEPGVPRVKFEMSNIANALRAYESTYNELPRSDNLSVSSALLGSNTQSIVFLYARTNNLGELIDPWNTAYRIEIEFTNRTNVIVQAAGKNRNFGDGDDYVLDSTMSNFAKEPKR